MVPYNFQDLAVRCNFQDLACCIDNHAHDLEDIENCRSVSSNYTFFPIDFIILDKFNNMKLNYHVFSSDLKRREEATSTWKVSYEDMVANFKKHKDWYTLTFQNARLGFLQLTRAELCGPKVVQRRVNYKMRGMMKVCSHSRLDPIRALHNLI